MTTPTDRQLIAALVVATKDKSLREAERATGISHQQISTYRDGESHYLTDGAREKIVRYLNSIGKLPQPRPRLSDAEIESLAPVAADLSGAIAAGERFRAARLVEQIRDVVG